MRNKISKPEPLKPRLFIGSAGESKDVAHKLQTALEPDVEATVWDRGFFEIGDITLDRLLEASDVFDFAAFVFTPDDVTNIRRKQVVVTRDNVVFEFGLFLGKLGRKRCFVVVPQGVNKLHLPTDLLALNYATYDPNRQDRNLLAALGTAADQIRGRVRALGRFNPSADTAAKQLVEEFHAYLSVNAVECAPDLALRKRKKLSVGELPIESLSPIWPPDLGKPQGGKRGRRRNKGRNRRI